MARDPYRYFRIEAGELVEKLGKGLLDLEKGESGAEMVAQLLRLAHTLKGAARVVRLPEIAEHAHAIEGLLGPFRDGSEPVGSGPINEVLQRVDRIAEGVAALGQPETAAPEPAEAGAQTNPAASPKPAAAAPQPADETLRTISTEVGEIDALLDGLSETFTRLSGLRDAVASMERARRVSELLAGQLRAPSGGGQIAIASVRADRAQAMADELRDALGSLERDLTSACDGMGRELQQVRDNAEQLRLVPAGTLFTTLERTARDAARTLGKSVTFEARGADVRIDGHVLRTVQGALVQLVRNAVAHGIEPPDARRAAGKPAAGVVAVAAERRGRRAVFRCRDDGSGVDRAALLAAAAKRGAATMPSLPAEPAGTDDIAGLLLRGGVSTASSVTEVAGRGIGMDVVRESIERLGGRMSVTTEAGKGTTISLDVPLSLAAIDALVVESGGTAATIPLDAVRYAQSIGAREIARAADARSIVFEDRVVPLVPLAQVLRRGRGGQERTARAAIVVAGGGGLAAFGVDRLRGFANVVVRPLPDLAAAEPFVAGASLDAEGNPQLVLDPDGLVAAALNAAVPPTEAEVAALPVLVVDDSLTTRMLERSILESAGYEVDLACSAEEALEIVQRKRYALMLVDVEMPGMDGFTLVERIRADAALHDIPAIMVTSLASPEHIKRGEDVGAQGYMIKSEFDQARLLARIGELAVRP